MTLEKASLPVPQFDKITLAELKEKIESCIAEGQTFLNELTETPKTAEEQLAILEHVDTLENNMSESWGILSHLNAVMNNAETRETYQSLLPGLSEYYTHGSVDRSDTAPYVDPIGYNIHLNPGDRKSVV